MALTAVGVLGFVGLAVDIGRMFIVKNESQAFCDAAAVAAAMVLNGASTGINQAVSKVATSPNKWNFGSTSVSTPVVSFATAAAGPWLTNPSPAVGYAYVRVTATVPMQLFFLPLVTGQRIFNVISTAVAAQVPITSLSWGASPYTAISTTPAANNFGFVIGNSYDIQWPTYNGNRAGCAPGNPDKCFNSPPCSGDPGASLSAVVANWGAKHSGYWGSNSNSLIAAEVLNTVQMAPIAIGTNLDPLLTAGNKQSEAGYLDQRASQDTDTSDATPSLYLANASHNGRRLLPVAIANPIDPTHTTVIGFGQFLLSTNGSPSDFYVKSANGNSPFCAVYAGPYNIGSSGPGAGGATGASSVRLME